MNKGQSREVFQEMRRLLMPWGISLLFPMPLLLAQGESASPDVAAMYVGLGAAWLSAEAFRKENAPGDAGGWRTRSVAVLFCLLLNVLAFGVMGWVGQMHSNIPWAVLSLLAVTPALGLIPWLVLRIGQPHAAILVGSLIVGSIKIAACIAARVAYGPDFIALGYVSADWNTAKLMISLMWGGTLTVSLVAAIAAYRSVMMSGRPSILT